MPEWADVLARAGSAALQQAVALLGGTYTPSELGLMVQMSENLKVAAMMLGDIAHRPDDEQGSEHVQR